MHFIIRVQKEQLTGVGVGNVQYGESVKAVAGVGLLVVGGQPTLSRPHTWWAFVLGK